MATTKKSEKKEFNTEKLTEMAKDLYLANLGVYGKIYEVLGDKVDEYNEKRVDLFKDLVKRGEKVQKNAEKRLKDTEDRIKNLELVKEMKLEDRISELRDNFNTLKTKLTNKKDEEAASAGKAPVAKAKAKAKSTASAATAKAKEATDKAKEAVAAA